MTNAWETKWYDYWDALTRQRTDGALVRLITPVYGGESQLKLAFVRAKNLGREGAIQAAMVCLSTGMRLRTSLIG